MIVQITDKGLKYFNRLKEKYTGLYSNEMLVLDLLSEKDKLDMSYIEKNLAWRKPTIEEIIMKFLKKNYIAQK